MKDNLVRVISEWQQDRPVLLGVLLARLNLVGNCIRSSG